MNSEDAKILEFNQYQKYDKASSFIYADLEFIIEKIDRCKNNLKSSSATKENEHITSDFLKSTIASFRSIKISMMYTEVKIVWKSFVNR